MFTGIVQTKGRVISLTPQATGVRLMIDRGGLTTVTPIAPGDSICVSGVCLTAIAADAKTLGFDMIPETLRLTTLGDLTPGTAVNLESSLTASTPMGGHFVQGHVDGVGVVERVVKSPQEWRVGIRPPEAAAGCIIPKGSIAVDGVSLTIAAVHKDGAFEVALIPTTLKITTMGEYEPGRKVNIESDIIARTVVNCLRNMADQGAGLQGATMEALRRAGFTA